MGRVVCYNSIVYTSDRSSAQVQAKCRQHSSIVNMEYNWAGRGYTSNDTFFADGSLDGALSLTVKATDQEGTEFTVTPEALNFIW